MSMPLTIFDVDGTLVRPKSGGEFRNAADDWEFIEDRHIKLLGLPGYRAIATNQGGVAFGYYSQEDVTRQIQRVAEFIRATYVGICCDHPKGTVAPYNRASFYRKPEPGMLLEAIIACHVTKADTLMVGDRDDDRQAAEAAGVRFEHADAFFDALPYPEFDRSTFHYRSPRAGYD